MTRREQSFLRTGVTLFVLISTFALTLVVMMNRREVTVVGVASVVLVVAAGAFGVAGVGELLRRRARRAHR